VNGVDVGSLTGGSYCSFEVRESPLTISWDRELKGMAIVQGVFFSIVLPPIGIASLWMDAADRYETTGAPPIEVGEETPRYLVFSGFVASGADLETATESDWQSYTTSGAEVQCSDPQPTQPQRATARRNGRSDAVPRSSRSTPIARGDQSRESHE